jgi:hypothetical protein
MDLGTIRERILATPLVRKLPEDQRKKFATTLLWIAETEDVSRTQLLIEQGEKNRDLGVLILEGMVRIRNESTQSKTIEAPDILGEVQLFTPDRARTATVEVVVGGKILSFSWKALAAECRVVFSDDEMDVLRKAIYDSAWTREEGLFDKLTKK